MKIINNIIIFLLCVSLIGFFANFAQNDYGALLTAICFWLVAGCFFIKVFKLLSYFKIVMACIFVLLLLSFVLTFIFEDFTAIVLILALLISNILYPLVFAVSEALCRYLREWP